MNKLVINLDAAYQAVDLVHDIKQHGLTDQDFSWRFSPKTYDIETTYMRDDAFLEIEFKDPKWLTFFSLKYQNC